MHVFETTIRLQHVDGAGVVFFARFFELAHLAYEDLLEVMGFDPVSLTTLADRSGLTPAELSSMLLILEFDGLVEALPGGRYARVAKRNS